MEWEKEAENYSERDREKPRGREREKRRHLLWFVSRCLY